MQLKDFDFRLWHKPSKSFVDMSVRGADLRIIPADDDYNMELELWSGLCDKNGKRIYEGDILAHDNGYGIEYHSKVVFESGNKNTQAMSPQIEAQIDLGQNDEIPF